MKENTLVKISIIFSLIGLLALYFISDRIKIGEYKPNAINSEIGQDTKLKGVVKSARKIGNTVVLEVEQNIISDVVILDKNNINLTAGEFIEAIGNIQEYNGKEEIIANRIRVIK